MNKGNNYITYHQKKKVFALYKWMAINLNTLTILVVLVITWKTLFYKRCMHKCHPAAAKW